MAEGDRILKGITPDTIAEAVADAKKYSVEELLGQILDTNHDLGLFIVRQAMREADDATPQQANLHGVLVALALVKHVAVLPAEAAPGVIEAGIVLGPTV